MKLNQHTNLDLFAIMSLLGFSAEPPVVKTKHPVQFFLDGVCLSESGMQYIKSLAPDQPKKIPRPRKMKQNLSGLSPFSLHTIDRNEDSTSAMAPGTIFLHPINHPPVFFPLASLTIAGVTDMFLFICFSVVLTDILFLIWF